jgi:phosphoesterase family protein
MQIIGDDDHKPLNEDPRFRWLDYLEADLKQADPFPNVIFLEPDYTDIPFGHSAPPNDDHPPSSIDFGQRFLARVYRAFSADPAIWPKCAILVTYDEHGGFFDHVEPPAITTPPAGTIHSRRSACGSPAWSSRHLSSPARSRTASSTTHRSCSSSANVLGTEATPPMSTGAIKALPLSIVSPLCSRVPPHGLTCRIRRR